MVADDGEFDCRTSTEPIGIVIKRASADVVENAIVGIERECGSNELAGRECPRRAKPRENVEIQTQRILAVNEIGNRIHVACCADNGPIRELGVEDETVPTAQ